MFSTSVVIVEALISAAVSVLALMLVASMVRAAMDVPTMLCVTMSEPSMMSVRCTLSGMPPRLVNHKQSSSVKTAGSVVLETSVALAVALVVAPDTESTVDAT